MKWNIRSTWFSRVSIGVGLVALCVTGFPSLAQQTADDDATRSLWDTAFKGSQKSSNRNRSKRGYRVATPQVSTTGVSGDSVVGLTVWRLRPSTANDAGERIIVHESAGNASWIPERVAGNAGLAEGDRVRISVEAARTGYLYVIDREQYADGSLGTPWLVFPTTRTLGGDNQVQAGRLIDIPAQEDRPPFFTLKRSRADQIGEVLTVLVTPKPLDELQIGAEAQKLTPEQVAEWERSWGAPAGRLELAGAVRQPWTAAEKQASAHAGKPLSAGGPAPEVLFYRPGVKPADPFLIKVQLQYGRRRAGARK
jgi:hypothetical protein